jgi:1,4-alpha-glucan branching enzyme
MKKTGLKNSSLCRVTFELPAEINAESVMLVGDFNDWSEDSTPLIKRKDGHFSVTLTLESNQSYQFRYLVDGTRWENDWNADAYVKNDKGTENSVIGL